MKIKKYDRKKALAYAKKWALTRNPKYYNFDPVGGDCTSFISQCIFSGSNQMNYSNSNGWYYKSGYDKSPSWSGVEYLYDFLTTNKGLGPYGRKVSIKDIEIGDIAQLLFSGEKFQHSLFIVDINKIKDLDNVFIATHTFDAYKKRISEYYFSKIRFIHIEKIRIY